MSHRLVVGLAVVLATLAPSGAAQAPAPSDAWLAFEGNWSASGQVHSMAIDSSNTAVVLAVSGPVFLSRTGGMSRGFSGAAIAFDDGEGASVGRAVWTDERGDRLVSRLQGQSFGSGGRFSGTFTGGTGRYSGATGDYTFAWQYVVKTPDGGIQGRTVGLTGRVRAGGDRR